MKFWHVPSPGRCRYFSRCRLRGVIEVMFVRLQDVAKRSGRLTERIGAEPGLLGQAA